MQNVQKYVGICELFHAAVELPVRISSSSSRAWRFSRIVCSLLSTASVTFPAAGTGAPISSQNAPTKTEKGTHYNAILKREQMTVLHINEDADTDRTCFSARVLAVAALYKLQPQFQKTFSRQQILAAGSCMYGH